MLNSVPLSLRINGRGFKKWVLLANILQTEPSLEYAPDLPFVFICTVDFLELITLAIKLVPWGLL